MDNDSFEDYPPRYRKRNEDGSSETDTERYWREVEERQNGVNRPVYDPWMGGYY